MRVNCISRVMEGTIGGNSLVIVNRLLAEQVINLYVHVFYGKSNTKFVLRC